MPEPPFKISQGTCESLLDIMTRESKKESFAEDVENTFKQEQPDFYKTIKSLLEEHEDNHSDELAFGIYFTYRAVVRQLEADKLNGK